MSINSTHPQYNQYSAKWARARDVLAGEDAIKAAAEKYVPRLAAQSDEEFLAYVARASFFNATARTADGFAGMIFRRAPVVRLPDPGEPLAKEMRALCGDIDLVGSSLVEYCDSLVDEVIGVGRCGSLIDWSSAERRPCLTFYQAEQIINWQMTRVNGRHVLSLLVLSETVPVPEAGLYSSVEEEQLRVYRLVPGMDSSSMELVVELWRWRARGVQKKKEWVLTESFAPERRGKALTAIPFVFHGPRHSRSNIDRLPLDDIIAVNLDHYRLNADYKHGMHYTALPTAWVSGFAKDASLKIGSSTAWQSVAPGATAGFLEYKGEGLATFERAFDRAERLMAVLGSRLLEAQKRAAETAEALSIRQTGEASVLSALANSVSRSITSALKWCYWWHGLEDRPENVPDEAVGVELNTDFEAGGMGDRELTAIVAAWQAGALSRDSMTNLLRLGELLPTGRSIKEEMEMVVAEGKQRLTTSAKA